MNTKKISESEIKDMKISSLPSRPTAPTSFGGLGFTASDLKAAFDKLPLFLVERFNSLITDIESEGEGSFSSGIPTGIAEGHNLNNIFEDIISGRFSEYLAIGEDNLADFKARADEMLATLSAGVKTALDFVNGLTIDCGTARERFAVVCPDLNPDDYFWF